MTVTRQVQTDVLVIGAGAAGMYAAVVARRAGADVVLLDKGRVGRSGATVMAQMTVAAAVGHAEADDWTIHYGDTLASGRDLCNEELAALMCHDGPSRILECGTWGVNWMRTDGRLDQVTAPGHSRRRCCFVGSLETGTGIVRGLRRELRRRAVASLETMFVTALIRDDDGAVVGAAALDLKRGEPVAFWAGAVILACGGLTELYERNSASVNMTGDAYALALSAGAELVDMEMVQFFPIANLAPRTIGLDPIMWDPFRYRLGGRLLNGDGEEFVERYTQVSDEGVYRATRDVLTYAILREVQEGRGSPAGGVWLDFTRLPMEEIRAAFPAAFDRLLEQGIDVSRRPVEVAPTAHYTIGGIRVDADMGTGVPGLFAAGEAVGGPHGANRLSGNALTEAFVFGARAGEAAALSAAEGRRGRARDRGRVAIAAMGEATRDAAAVRGRRPQGSLFLPALRRRLQRLMWELVGPVRRADRLRKADSELIDLRVALEGEGRVGSRHVMNIEWREWLELRGMLDVAQAVCTAAAARTESRGAHQREDFPGEDDGQIANVVVRRAGHGSLDVSASPVVRLSVPPEQWSPADITSPEVVP